MKNILTIIITIIFNGCGTTTGTPTPVGKDTFIVTSMADLFPRGHEPVLEDAIKKGTEYISKCWSLRFR